jgi:serine/threonine-protein kinase HipA
MTNELVVLLDGNEVGRVRNDARGRLTLVYNGNWRGTRGAYPLSLSMPLAAKEHGPTAVQAFLWGLLPDNERVLDRWAKKFQVSARNVFALISHVGEDCAGAVQFVTPDRLEALKSGKDDKVEWLDEAAIAKRLQALREDHAAWRLPHDTGQFSLAGAQPKTALLLQKDRWGIPSGRIPTTHILKPPTGHFDGHAENEHICLKLARSLGMPVADTKVMRFEKEIAIIIERYDRQFSGNTIIRVHQEDICQVMGVLPTRKYQNEGGPAPADIVELLRSYSTDRETDLDTFVDALGFNWLIAGTDAHAKNYSLLLASGPTVRFAPPHCYWCIGSANCTCRAKAERVGSATAEIHICLRPFRAAPRASFGRDRQSSKHLPRRNRRRTQFRAMSSAHQTSPADLRLYL